jgi:molybdopterin synthase catalytic subunit
MANPVCEVLLTETQLTALRDDVDLAAGAVVDFWGIVRASEDGREIDGIEYEAHREMAEHQLRRIAQQSVEIFALELIIIHHRIGFIAVGQSSLFVRVASQHRREAFQASQWVVGELKKKVPIWKRAQFKIESRAANLSSPQPGSATPATTALLGK